MNLPEKNKWLYNEPGPKMLQEAIRHYGELEHVGKGSNPNIMAWAKEVGVSGWYTDDDVPWCGLFVGVVAKRAGYPLSASKLLAAREWLNWGQIVPIERAMLWDVLVFSRDGGGHVGFYAGEDTKRNTFEVYGGNQNNRVGFATIDKGRCIGVRKPIYKIGQPANVRKIYLTADGKLSTNES